MGLTSLAGGRIRTDVNLLEYLIQVDGMDGSYVID